MTEHLFRRAMSLACVALCAAGVATPARAAAHYTLTDLGAWSVPAVVNRSHEIVGMSAGDTAQATWRNGTWTPIALPAPIGAPQSVTFTGINAAGKMVGSAPTGENGLPQPLVVDPRGIVSLDSGDTDSCELEGINDRGTILGFCAADSTTFVSRSGVRTPVVPPSAGSIFIGKALNRHDDLAGAVYKSGEMDLVLYANGKWTTIESLPTESAHVSAMNDARHVVGVNFVASGNGFTAECFFYDGRAVKDLYLQDCVPTGMNDHDQVVGWYSGANDTPVAFLVEPGRKPVDLQPLVNDLPRHWVLQRAFGISDDGAIIGMAVSTDDNTNHGFLLTPVTP